jgi:hypothetical protein
MNGEGWSTAMRGGELGGAFMIGGCVHVQNVCHCAVTLRQRPRQLIAPDVPELMMRQSKRRTQTINRRPNAPYI